MNAALRAVVRTGIYFGLQVIGISRGYSGLLEQEYREMHPGSVADIIQRGGTILRTARCEKFLTEEGQATGAKNLRDAGIEGLVVIGGDGSFRGALALADRGIKVIGVPGTIDNDIAGTDYTIGFDTAVNTVVEAINKIRDTATSHERIFLIEVMGRTSGDIALAAGIAGGAESILIPEIDIDLDGVVEKIERGRKRGKLHSIIIVAEGAGSALEIGRRIQAKIKLETRETILGHIQRGGTPTAFDRILASRLGVKAVELLIDGKTAKMVGMGANKIISADLKDTIQQPREIVVEVYKLAGILAT